MITIQKAGKPATHESLAAFEKRFAVKLPASVRTWFLRYNGGVPEQAVFPITDFNDNPNDSVMFFFGIDTGRDYDDLLQQLPHFELLPGHVLPLAEASAGCCVVVALSGPHMHKIFYWAHEEALLDNEWRGMFLVAQSIEEFESLLS